MNGLAVYNEVLALLTIRDNKGHLLIGKRFGEKVFSAKLRLALMDGKDFGALAENGVRAGSLFRRVCEICGSMGLTA